MNVLYVAIGGAVGSVLRYLITILHANSRILMGLPINTFVVNILGSFLIGVAFALLSKYEVSLEKVSLLLVTGVLGGFTTFSAFSLENLKMINSGEYLNSLIYISSTIIFVLLAVFLGFKVFS